MFHPTIYGHSQPIMILENHVWILCCHDWENIKYVKKSDQNPDFFALSFRE